jgi:hypothetical protein
VGFGLERPVGELIFEVDLRANLESKEQFGQQVYVMQSSAGQLGSGQTGRVPGKPH